MTTDIAEKTIEMNDLHSSYLKNSIEKISLENPSKTKKWFLASQRASQLVQKFDSTIEEVSNIEDIKGVFTETRNSLNQIYTSIEWLSDRDSLPFDSFYDSDSKIILKSEIHLIENIIQNGIYGLINSSDCWFIPPYVELSETFTKNSDSTRISLQSKYFQQIKDCYIFIDSVSFNGETSDNNLASGQLSDEFARIMINTTKKGEYTVYGNVKSFSKEGIHRVQKEFEYSFTK